MQAQIAQAQRVTSQQVQTGMGRPQQQQQQQQQRAGGQQMPGLPHSQLGAGSHFSHPGQQQPQQQQRWQAGQQPQRPTPRPPTGVPARVAPRTGPSPVLSQQQQGASRPAVTPSQPAVRAAEAVAAARRYKKRKATDKHVPEHVAQLVPESAMYGNIMASDRQMTALLNHKKASIREALAPPTRASKRLRVVISSTHEHQAPLQYVHGGGPRDDASRDPPSWTLLMFGEVVDPNTPSGAGGIPGMGQGTAPRPAQAKAAPLMQHIKRVRVQLDETQYPGPAGILDWDRSHNARDFKRCLEIRRRGSKDVPVQITIEPERSPEHWQLSEKLQSLVGRELATKSQVFRSLWAHISAHNLQHTSDPSLITCDPLLKALFGGSEPALKLGSFVSRVSTHLFPPRPAVINYTIRTSGPPESPGDCIEFDLELPAAPISDRTAPFLDVISRQHQIDQVDARIANLMSKAEEHRRRRSFFLAFSQSPVDFMNALIASQGRDLYASSKEGVPDFEALRRTDLFKGKSQQQLNRSAGQ
ncbi:hypothetical protein WJX84_002103 [Apatococcus fuscideae]|uniref:DM2 domain-containing protein n=1 Tax=Apatococcus fuscideae TaxID=2026836 RepID=A0AAW1S0P9_9CHLO